MIPKFVLAMAVVFLWLTGYSQTSQRSTVSGHLHFTEKQNRILDITYRRISGGYQFDSTTVINGTFRFQKEISEPIIVIISLKSLPGTQRTNQGGGPDYLSLLLTPGVGINLNGTTDLKNATLSGTGATVSNEYHEYLQQLNMYVVKGNNTLAKLKELKLDSVTNVKRITEIQDSINLERDQRVHLAFIQSKSQSPVGALALLSYAGEPVWRPRKKISPAEIEQLLTLLPKKFLSYPSFISLKEELAISKATGYGKPIIDFALEDTAGKLVKLSDFKGQYVFLDFWASWCVPCRKENPNVIQQFQRYKDKGFTVLSVSLDKPDAKQAWLAAIKKDQIGIWTQVADLNGFDGKVAQQYFVKSIPTNFLIAPDGTFLGRNLYGEQLEKELKQLFSK